MPPKTFLRSVMDDPANRHPNDYYPTSDPRGTNALLDVETFTGPVWEPACGDGAMSKILMDRLRGPTISTDLHDYGFGTTGLDFLTTDRSDWKRLLGRNTAMNIITNPPYKFDEEFVLHGLSLKPKKMAMLLRLAWMEGQWRRDNIFRVCPPARVWVFSKRLSLDRGGVEKLGPNGKKNGGMIAFSWWVWEEGHVGNPALGWLEG